jgi:excinuclease UvrABC ATPase subunit
MDLKSQENTHSTVDQSVVPIVCPVCNQSYFFETECPSCNGKIKEKTEALELSIHIKNITDIINVADLYECNLDDLRKLETLLVKLLKQIKEF